jgi:hypothetical protein
MHKFYLVCEFNSDYSVTVFQLLFSRILVTPLPRCATSPFGIVLYSVKYIVKNMNRILEISIGLAGMTGFQLE